MKELQIKILIEKLIALGESREELELWQKLFPDLEPSEQEKLLKNLEEELAALKKLKK